MSEQFEKFEPYKEIDFYKLGLKYGELYILYFPFDPPKLLMWNGYWINPTTSKEIKCENFYQTKQIYHVCCNSELIWKNSNNYDETKNN